MSPDRDAVELPAALLAWLATDEHEIDGWADDLPLEALRCHPDLVERLSQIARPAGPVGRVWVEGCPVVHHPNGSPIACASGTSVLLVRSGLPAGELAASFTVAGLHTTWRVLDPWSPDVTFAKTLELLRSHVAQAFARAEQRAWH